MIQTIGFSEFCDAFYHAGRKDQFSYQAKLVLFDYLEEQEGSLGEQYELDVIALCGEFSEDTPESIAVSYDIDLEDVAEDDVLECVLDYLNDETQICGTTADGAIVYVQF